MGRIFVLSGMFALMSTAAFAQAPTCERQEGFTCGPAKAAFLGKTVGDVVILGRTAAAAAMAVDAASVGTGLAEGDRVISRDGSSEIDLGPGCLVSLPNKAAAQIYRLGPAKICVSVSDLVPAAPPAAPPTAPVVPPIVYGLGGAAFVGGGVAAAVMAKRSGASSSPVSAQ